MMPVSALDGAQESRRDARTGGGVHEAEAFLLAQPAELRTERFHAALRRRRAASHGRRIGVLTAQLTLDPWHVQPLHLAQVFDPFEQREQLGAVEPIAAAGANRRHEPFALPEAQRRCADADDSGRLADGEEAVASRGRRPRRSRSRPGSFASAAPIAGLGSSGE